MASAELRQIRRRIRSVESTMKITRAMELIATSRIAKAQVRVQQSQPYIAKMTDVIRSVLDAEAATMPKDKPGAVQGDDLKAILHWAEVYDGSYFRGEGHGH